MNAPETIRFATPPGLGSGSFRGAATASLGAQELPARYGRSQLGDPAQWVAGMHRAGRSNRKQVANRCFDCGSGLLFG